ncbi:MAG TPA: D-sedoheptulose 7-phosphate isomerase [Acidobacteriaceae bacterium]
MNSTSTFEQAISAHLSVIHSLTTQLPLIERIAKEITDSVLAGNKILWCGNGGSAADSQHLAAEFVGRFRRERRGLPSIALTTDTSILTAVGNDYGFEKIFARQVEALCMPNDVVVGISTSGNSKNVCLALEKARELGARTIAFTGSGGGEIARLADLTLGIASNEAARVQEAHILCGHMICDWMEAKVSEEVDRRLATEEGR